MTQIHYRTADVDGFNIFYREAGSSDAPKLLLLHGFPSSGHMFRDLIPLIHVASILPASAHEQQAKTKRADPVGPTLRVEMIMSNTKI